MNEPTVCESDAPQNVVSLTHEEIWIRKVTSKQHILCRALISPPSILRRTIIFLICSSAKNELWEYSTDLVSIAAQFGLRSGPFLDLRGCQAQLISDLLQHILDNLRKYTVLARAEDHFYLIRRHISNILPHIARRTGQLPTPMVLCGVKVDDKAPFAGGSFANIYRGRLGSQRVAIKCLRTFTEMTTEDLNNAHKRFCKEAVGWYQVRHPNVLPLLGVAVLGESRSMGMISPWMINGNVLQYLAHTLPNMTTTTRLVTETAKGLAYLHSCGIVHKDLRGRNILVDESGHVKIGDFGLSVFGESAVGQPPSNGAAGSTRWMAPDLLGPETEFPYPTAESDVYAFACVCLEMFTQRPPFFHVFLDVSVIPLVLAGTRPNRPTVDGCGGFENMIPDKLWELVSKCWAQEAHARPTMSEVVAKLPSILPV